MTSINALRHAYESSGADETRKIVLLQATAFVTFFRQRLGDKLPDEPKIDEFAKQDTKGGEKEALESIFDAIDRKRPDAAAMPNLWVAEVVRLRRNRTCEIGYPKSWT